MMDLDPQDQDIVGLLTKLKSVNGGYPTEMLAARRQSYLKQMAELGVGTGAVAGLKHAVKNANTPTVPPVTSTLLEAALVVAILAEAGTVVYFYRDKIADFFQTETTGPRVQEVTPVAPTVLEIRESTLTPAPAATATVPTHTVVPVTASATGAAVTVSSTPIPEMADENNPDSSGAANPNQSNSSLSAPGGNNDNPGNHYGQTPQPERTKESGNSDTGSNNNNNNDTPPENNNDQPPKENSKPPKTK